MVRFVPLADIAFLIGARASSSCQTSTVATTPIFMRGINVPPNAKSSEGNGRPTTSKGD